MANKPKPYTRLLNCQDVADYLGLKVETIWAMARAGQVPCFRINGRYRFRMAELDRWLKGKTQKCRVPEGAILPG